MPIINRIAEFHTDMTEWRRDIHAHPELSMQEFRTSAMVQEKLKSFGVDEIITGMAGTGVVGVIRAGTSDRAIGLRADMDALPIQEDTGLPHASQTPNVMHACGHDGHTTMLLGAAKYLAETRNFDGTVYLVFQPAEEFEGGAAPLAPLPINGRLNKKLVGALITPSTSCSSVCSGDALAASAAAYAPSPEVKVCTNWL